MTKLDCTFPIKLPVFCKKNPIVSSGIMSKRGVIKVPPVPDE